MNEPRDLLSRVRVAAPCPAGWDAMEGDDRTRFCRLCQLNVYNVAGMTEREVVALVTRSEGRVCARLFRRADGTLLTKDCPTGLRALRRRVSRAAGAVFAAALGLFAVGPARVRAQEAACSVADWLRVERTSASTHATLSGTVIDPNGAAVPGVELTLTLVERGRKFEARADGEGRFRFPALPAGTYTLEAGAPNFQRFVREDLTVAAGDVLSACVALDVGGMLLGVVVVDPEPDRTGVESRGGATVFRRKAITRLPF
jgi:hypothetical protein